jgi:hypothetical protein
MNRHAPIAAAMLSAAMIGCGFGPSTALAASPQDLVDAAYKPGCVSHSLARLRHAGMSSPCRLWGANRTRFCPL